MTPLSHFWLIARDHKTNGRAFESDEHVICFSEDEAYEEYCQIQAEDIWSDCRVLEIMDDIPPRDRTDDMQDRYDSDPCGREYDPSGNAADRYHDERVGK